MSPEIRKLLDWVRKGRLVSTDTRKISPGSIFFALRGDTFDGNTFAEKALELGADIAVIDNTEYISSPSERYLVVPDTLKALQELARAYREGWDFPVIGLTGSNGKTTSKELIYSVLSTQLKAYATKGNLNNHIGVPLTLLAVPATAEIAIIEMGANQPGDIKELSEIALPTHGFITNIGSAHLEKLGSIEGVKKTKGELFDFLRKVHGKVFLNTADPNIAKMGTGLNIAYTYGDTFADFHFSIIRQGLEDMEMEVLFSLWEKPLPLYPKLGGIHNAMNILVATAIGTYFGIRPENIQKGIAAYVPVNNRSQLLVRDGVSYWMDAYNANPSSMGASIQHVFNSHTGNILLILGDMLELGEESEMLHRELGKFINSFKPFCVVGIGKFMRNALLEIEGNTHWFESSEEAQEFVQSMLPQVDLVFVKGSRGMAVEKSLNF